MRRNGNRTVRPAALLSALALACACSSDEDLRDTEWEQNRPEPMDEPESIQEQAPPFGTPMDVSLAKDLWMELEGYREWPSWPGMEGWQEGKSPHGAWLRYWVSPAVAQSPEELPDGALIVKGNYPSQDEGALKSLTVMKKVEGYDPPHEDWFWAKYAPDGGILEDEQGLPLVGRVAQGREQGCIACHSRAAGGDYVFANDEGEGR